MKGWTFLVALLASLVAGCRTDRVVNRPAKMIALIPNESEMREEVLRHVPVGSALESAQQLMEANGFKCSESSDNVGPYLYCDQQRSVDAFVSRRWQIKIREVDGRVSDVVVHTGAIGL